MEMDWLHTDEMQNKNFPLFFLFQTWIVCFQMLWAINLGNIKAMQLSEKRPEDLKTSFFFPCPPIKKWWVSRLRPQLMLRCTILYFSQGLLGNEFFFSTGLSIWIYPWVFLWFINGLQCCHHHGILLPLPSPAKTAKPHDEIYIFNSPLSMPVRIKMLCKTMGEHKGKDNPASRNDWGCCVNF